MSCQDPYKIHFALSAPSLLFYSCVLVISRFGYDSDYLHDTAIAFDSAVMVTGMTECKSKNSILGQWRTSTYMT